MILDALYTTVSGICNAYPLTGDIEAEMPFCIFRAEPELIRTKDGLIGYDYTVNMGIVDADPDVVDGLTDTISAAVLSITGTLCSTVFESVMQTDESGIYDMINEGNTVYENDLEFRISTLNR